MAAQQQPNGFDVLAVIGAATGVLSLAIEAARFRHDRPRLTGSVTTTPENDVRFYITNEGGKPVSVVGVQVVFMHHRITRSRRHRIAYRLHLVKTLPVALSWKDFPEPALLGTGETITVDWPRDTIINSAAALKWTGAKPQLDPVGLSVLTAGGKARDISVKLQRVAALQEAFFNEPTFRRGRKATDGESGAS